MSLEQEVTVVIVTYNTHKALLRAVSSINKKYPKIKILVVDNSKDGSESLPGYEIIKTYKNIGHGPGMDLGIKAAKTPKVLLCDSDIVLVRKGIIEKMLERFSDDVYGIGNVIKINNQGQNGPYVQEQDKTVCYLHPYFMLIDRAKYLELPPFIHHGAPCIKTMLAIPESGYKIVDFIVKRFVHHSGRTTRKLNPKEFNSKTWEKV